MECWSHVDRGLSYARADESGGDQWRSRNVFRGRNRGGTVQLPMAVEWEQPASGVDAIQWHHHDGGGQWQCQLFGRWWSGNQCGIELSLWRGGRQRGECVYCGHFQPAHPQDSNQRHHYDGGG